LSGSVFVLEGATVRRAGTKILGPMSFRVRDRAITVVLGPAGTGKSSLLRALAGTQFDVELEGRCDRYGAARDSTQIGWHPQRARHGAPGDRDGLRWLLDPRPLLLLDEPERGLSDDDCKALERGLRAHATRGAAVVVTHHIGFARRVADEVVLLCDGRLHAAGSAPGFFESPPSALAARFLRDGNCWPTPFAPSLPSHFQWVLPGKLAGCGSPGLLGEADADLLALAQAGVTLLVSLTEEPLPLSWLRDLGIRGRHLPIRDMGIPAIAPTARLCREVEREMVTGAVAVHCHAGLGRTGTVLAAVLVWRGESPERAITKLRALKPGFIQTRSRESFVRRFAEAV
jgi:atypical dual specificity phosphatase